MLKHNSTIIMKWELYLMVKIRSVIHYLSLCKLSTCVIYVWNLLYLNNKKSLIYKTQVTLLIKWCAEAMQANKWRLQIKTTKVHEMNYRKPYVLPLLCRNSRAVALVVLGLMAGWLTGWLADWLAGWPEGGRVGRRVGRWAGVRVGWLAGWPAGWLAGRRNV